MAIPKAVVLEMAKLNNCTLFVETGTYHGQTARWASQHFNVVHTIERSEKLFNSYGKNLSHIRSVTAHMGDSRVILPRVVKEFQGERALYWLDGHWSGGDTAGGDDECPLLSELACLSGRTEDIILIDDARLFLRSPPPPHNPVHWPTISDVIYALPAGREKPFVQIADDVIFVLPDKDILKTFLVDYIRKCYPHPGENTGKLQQIKSIFKMVTEEIQLKIGHKRKIG